MKQKEISTRAITFENPTGSKGMGGMENSGAKGHAFDAIKAGTSRTIFDVAGSGIIHRMWFTLSDRSAIMLRALLIEIYWDNADKPAVSVPFGDFFCCSAGEVVAFENELFSSPEGRSFNSYVQMPFKKSAKIIIRNESDKDLPHLFYEVNYSMCPVNEDAMYFHAFWRRNLGEIVGEDYEILPNVKGEGRLLGVSLGLIKNPSYEDSWWGEGEVKVFLDENGTYPTLVNTGTEDYIGTGWGQGLFTNRYQGSLVKDDEKGRFSFYRLYIPDPVFFKANCNMFLQQIGGTSVEKLIKIIKNGAAAKPISFDSDNGFVKLLEHPEKANLEEVSAPENVWCNFYRLDDYCSTAYFYLDSPINNLPSILSLNERIAKLHEEQKS